MRKIKFRGKVYMSDIWSYGYLVDDFVIKDINEGVTLMVDAKTIGQFTGLKDKNGREIYEGDILKSFENLGLFKQEEYPRPTLVKYNDARCQFLAYDYRGARVLSLWSDYGLFEVIGNIYDNPELLEGKE